MFKLVLLALADQPGDTAEGEARHRPAARLAGNLAARHGAGFVALHVSGPLSQEGGCVLQLPGEDALNRHREGLEALLRGVMPPGLTADVAMVAGFAHVEILKTVRVLGPDLLVLGGLEAAERCRRELSASPSSAALLVAKGAPCPVLVATSATPEAPSTASPGPFERILVGVADDETGQVGRLLGFAARLAAREGAELHVLHALSLAPDAPTPGHEEMVRRTAQVRDHLGYLCQGLPAADRFTISVSEGAAGVEILKHARERQADLILLAPRHAGQGGVAGHVLTGARCPVLLLGPSVPVAAAQKPVTKG